MVHHTRERIPDPLYIIPGMFTFLVNNISYSDRRRHFPNVVVDGGWCEKTQYLKVFASIKLL